MRGGIRVAVLASVLVASLTASALAGKGGKFGADENASVTTVCVDRGGFLVNVLFYIETKEDHDACVESGNQPIGFWDLDYFIRRFSHLWD